MNKLEIKTIWPEWKIDDLIGEGASGKVYKAKRTDSKDVYSAIKVIEIPQNESEVKEARAEGLDDVSIKQYFKSFVDELISEISLLENLKSAQNIVGIEDYKVIEKEDKIGYIIYIRMELLTGVDNYFSQNTLEEKLVIKLGVDLCQALEYCEKLKIIHRDIKPENIFVSKFGEFKLGDFGIARKLENTSSIMSKKGTYIYMAPEVYKGNSYDKTVDIYSLGLVMYRFCNNNRTPFLPEYPQSITFKDKENALYKRMDGEKIPKPGKMSEELYKIISKMCEYEPENRYKNVSDVKRDLEKLLNSGIYNGNKESEITHEGTVNIFSEAVKAKKIEQIKQQNEQAKTNKIKNIVENNTQEEIFQKMKKIQTVNKNNLKPNSNEASSSKSNKNELLDASKNKKVLSNENTVNFTDKGNIKVKKEQKSQEIKSGDKKTKNQNKKTIILILIILLLILIFILFKMFLKPKKPETIEVVNKLTVPNVTLMQIEDAKQALNELELELQIEEIYQEDMENGVVIYQSLEENTPVKKGDKLVLLVNNLDKKQIEKVIIPNVVGKTIDEASTILAELGLMVEKTEEYNNDVDASIVIIQNIEENVEVEKGTTVSLTVSLGKEKQEEEQTNNSQEQKNNTSNNEKNIVPQKNNIQQSTNQTSNTNNAYESNQPQSQQTLSTITSEKNELQTKSIFNDEQTNLQTISTSNKEQTNSQTTAQQSNNNEKNAPTQSSNQNSTESTKTNQNISTSNSSSNTQVSTWSNWVESLPSGVNSSSYNIETKTQYSYRTKQTTTSTNSSLSGWTKDTNNTQTSFSDWSSEKTSESKPTASDCLTIVREETVTEKIYYHYQIRKGGNIQIFSPTAKEGYAKHTIKTIENWPEKKYGGTKCPTCEGNTWFFQENSRSYKVYIYKTRTKITTYSYYKMSDWSAYSDTPVSKNDNNEIRTRTLYRYKAK